MPMESSLSGSGSSVQITASRESFEEPKLKFTVHLMQLTAQDQHSLQLDSSMIPSPKFRQSYSFKLPIGDSVVYVLLVIRHRHITDAELYFYSQESTTSSLRADLA